MHTTTQTSYPLSYYRSHWVCGRINYLKLYYFVFGEFTSIRFEEFLKSEGVCHESTVPKMPEQNGVGERLNQTLVETVCLMLIDLKFPHKFWAEGYLRSYVFKKPK